MRNDEDDDAHLHMTHISKGHVVALFAFDIGLEVSLEQLGALLESAQIQPLSPKKQTPPYVQYSKPPRIVNLTPNAGTFPDLPGLPDVRCQVQATVFDFGAVSIAYRWPIPATSNLALEDLPKLSQQIYRQGLEARARDHARWLMASMLSAITRPELSRLVEDYYLFIIEELASSLTADQLIAEHRQTMAQVLRFETERLSHEQQSEALKQRISYYETDLVVVDWNAAIIYDRDYWDAANVLELLNVELLEARYVDGQLDLRIGEYQKIVPRPIGWFVPLRNPYRKAIQDLAELRIESLLLAERVENVLKLIGDLYLARVHAAATERFYLPTWQTAISRKLDIVGDFYQLLTDRVRSAQSQTLELVIIALILAEILMAIFS
jgi:hypothetical protein